MLTIFKTTTFGLIVLLNFSILCSEELEQYETATGFKGTYNKDEKVFKISIPRIDISEEIGNILLDPFMGLTSWIAFTQFENMFMAMGDLVLLQDEETLQYLIF